MQKQKIFVKNTIIIDISNVKLATLAFQSTKIMFDIEYLQNGNFFSNKSFAFALDVTIGQRLMVVTKMCVYHASPHTTNCQWYPCQLDMQK